MRILIVDDDSEWRSILGLFLTQKGYEPFMAKSGRLALEFLILNRVDLVISDIQMLDGDGWWLLQQMQVMKSSPRVIIFSGDPTARAEVLMQKGALAFFPKNSLHALMSYLSEMA